MNENGTNKFKIIMLIHWECLQEMDKLIEQWVKADSIITDIPYWTTACKWDTVIPFPEMWERLNKLIKPNWAIVLFWSEPFSSALRMSNIKNYKYDWVWNKVNATWHLQAKRMPMKKHENIMLFFNGWSMYNPQWLKPFGKMVKRWSNWENYNPSWTENFQEFTWYPRSILEYKMEKWRTHPTQKPVALMEYLIKTYTQEWETVLDFTMWSWSTGVWCVNTNRNFIWIEMDENYFNIAKERLNK